MKNINSLTIISIPFLLGIYLKQFYILPSGSLQLGDICFFLSFLFVLLFRKLTIKKIDTSIIVFVCLAIIINLLYYLFYKEIDLLLYSSYLIFSLTIILTFRVIYNYIFFEKKVLIVIKASLLTQIIINVLGLGRAFGTIRYEGTFNDPNQFGYYILTSFFLLFLYSKINNKNLNIIWYFITIFLIFKSASSGMFLGFTIFLILFVFVPSFSPKHFFKNMFLFVVMSISAFLLFSILNELFKLYTDSYLGGRLISKFSNPKGDNIFLSFLNDRNLNIIIKAPYFFLFGFGEGVWFRNTYYSSLSSGFHELHSTMIALFFYYGLLPYLFFIKWIINNVKDISIKYLCVFVALIAEAFTLINHRQPFFWMLLVLASHPKLKSYNDKVIKNFKT